MARQGFDNDQYLKLQSQHIRERIAQFGGKLYLEFGGKLFDDFHASRVLPGFEPDSKIRMLAQMKDSAEVIIAINAADIEKNKVRGDLGITYDSDVLRLIDAFRSMELYVGSVVVTQYSGQPAADAFQARLEQLGVRVYRHYPIAGYPHNIAHIVSDEGFGKNQYIETSRPLVVVTAPGPGSGKLATCLSQLYHEYRRGRSASYSKFETFPVWNVPLKHPLNVAYEAATVDLKDVNIIDSFHFDAYGVPAVNYNRDMEMFPVISRIIEKITGKESIYKSPTDMGVNRVGFGIIDDEVVKEASRQEIIRRYFKTSCEYKKGTMDEETFHRMDAIMKDMKLRPEDRKVVAGARSYAAAKGLETGEELLSATAIELEDGTIVTGRSSELMNSSAAAILNAVKQLAGIADEIHLISPVILQPIIDLKSKTLGSRRPALDCEEILMALSICAVTNPTAQVAMEKLPQLKNCQAHTTTILNRADEQTFRKLGVDVTCDPVFPSENLYYV